jgi:hypothetical protein
MTLRGHLDYGPENTIDTHTCSRPTVLSVTSSEAPSSVSRSSSRRCPRPFRVSRPFFRTPASGLHSASFARYPSHIQRLY